MATAATFGKGTLLQVESATPGTYTTIPECKAIRPPNADPDEEDVSNQDSPGAAKEFVRTFIDYGEVSVDCNYLPENAVHQQLIADASSVTAVTRNYRILLVGGTRAIDFTAWCKAFERDLPHDGVYKGTIRLRVTGAPVEETSP
jgi:hypothetical protein